MKPASREVGADRANIHEQDNEIQALEKDTGPADTAPRDRLCR